MVNRHRCKVVVGLGALLGLCTVGCEPGSLYTLPAGPGLTPTRSLMAPPPVQLMRPRAVAEEPGELRQVVAVSTNAPAFRPADSQYAGGVVVASSWRPMPSGKRGTAVMPPTEMVPPTVSTGPVIGPELQTSIPRELPVETTVAEHLTTMPHKTPDAAASVIGQPAQPATSGPHGLLAPHEPHDDHGPDGRDVPHEGNKQALPPYVIEPPDVLLIEFTRTGLTRPLRGEFLVGPDGVVNLGTYGPVRVGGLTIEQARTEIAAALQRGNVRPLKEPLKDEEGKDRKKDGKVVYGPEIPIRDEVIVDVVAYNSKFYYVISDGAGYGVTIARVPVNGSDTVMDALARIGGLPPVSSKKKIFVARANLGHPGMPQLLPVDWHSLLHGEVTTNYQLVAGDRVFVGPDLRVLLYNQIDKTLNPIDRVFRSLLLGSTTVNSISRRTGGTGTGAGASAVPIIPVGGG